MVRDFILGAILLAMVVGAFLGLFLGWTQWRGAVNDSPLPPWRLAIARIGLLTITVQALLFISLWTPLVHYNALLRQCVPFEFLLLLVAVPCVLLGNAKYRWWLLACSGFLPVVSFFVIVAETAY
jgi:hypothetical protein